MDELCRRLSEAIDQSRPCAIRAYAREAVDEIRRLNDLNAQKSVSAFLYGAVAGASLILCGAAFAALLS